ncbi:hypothetical protein L6R49_13930 [Myxococcota bacterium]|nr:hypothetical protein [Myxococcota bacterium]
MIPVRRGAEPAALAQARARHLHLAMAVWAATGSANGVCFEGYGVARDILHAAQHSKCAYCEQPSAVPHELPVEHYRPKAGAQRDPNDPRSIDPDRYWWLAWSWENLLFACVTCNGRSRKASHFPIEGPPAPIKATDRADLDAERPLLLDPSRDDDDPRAHIAWVPIDPTAPRARWRWIPTHRTVRGKMTIRVLKLRSLEDAASAWVNSQILPEVEHIEALMTAGRAEEAQATCERLNRRLFAPTAGWHALSACALKVLLPGRAWGAAP